jgi:hypothetical protein
MIYNRNLDIIEKNSAASSSCRLCSDAFLMFRGARKIMNTMLLFVEELPPPPHQQIQRYWLGFLPSLSLSLSSLCVACRRFAYISQKGEREDERILV